MIPESDLKIETMRGTGPGGQRKNKVSTCVRITHIPSGLSVTIDTRSQQTSMKKARKEIEKRVAGLKATKKAADKKARRDIAIHNTPTVRTYDFQRGVVRDHRTKKTASLKDVLVKGKIELLR